jgi:hypothetical protein
LRTGSGFSIKRVRFAPDQNFKRTDYLELGALSACHPLCDNRFDRSFARAFQAGPEGAREADGQPGKVATRAGAVLRTRWKTAVSAASRELRYEVDPGPFHAVLINAKPEAPGLVPMRNRDLRGCSALSSVELRQHRFMPEHKRRSDLIDPDDRQMLRDENQESPHRKRRGD